MADDLYSPLCTECSDMGNYTLATEAVGGPLGRQPACARHYDARNERRR